MMAANATSPVVNADGFLVEISTWDRAKAEEMARRNEIWPLSEDHWKVIHFVRDYYQKFRQGPAIYKISRATGLNARRICEIFPCGIVRGAYRLAGLPRPPGCA
ncbi:MAG TPA: TusE/DsrC/DsvC family sulfur relay protein [bacterium]